MRAAPLRPLVPLLALGLLLGSCFEPPVVERLHLRFLPNSAVVVTSTVELADREGEGNPALARRLAETRQALLAGDDAWSRRFAALEPAAERSAWEKRLGVLREVKRSAALAEPAELGSFFADTALQVSFAWRDGLAELTIVPGAPQGGSREQRRKVEARLGPWCSEVAEYLSAGTALWGYLDEHPDRARPCLAVLLRDVLPEEQQLRLEDLPAEEARRVEATTQAMEEVLAVLAVGSGESYSLDELSRLVFDPFPARLTVALPSPAVEQEGFVPGSDGTLAVPGLSLWEALRALEGRWLSPDPALLTAAHLASGKPLDLDGVLAGGRSATAPPEAEEVRRALLEGLAPASLYRAAWRTAAPGEEDDTPFDWQE
jgi:hypothetical protein